MTKLDEEKVVTPTWVTLLVMVIFIALLGAGWKLYARADKPSDELVCALLSGPFSEVGQSDDWYNATAMVLKSSCDYEHTEFRAAQQICKTHYMQKKLKGEKPEACLDMDFK